MTDSIEELLREAYSETHKMLKDPKLGSVVKDGLLISYGPPIQSPDLLLLSFQGGGDSPVVQETWPQEFLYLNSPYKFGTKLRKLCRDTGLSESLRNSAMAFPAVFPQDKQAGRWIKETGPHADWRRHSVDWVTRLAKAIKPKVVIVFGKNTSDAFGFRREDTESAPGRGLTFGESTFHDAPAVFCRHLSQGYSNPEVLKSFRHAKRLIPKRS